MSSTVSSNGNCSCESTLAWAPQAVMSGLMMCRMPVTSRSLDRACSKTRQKYMLLRRPYVPNTRDRFPLSTESSQVVPRADPNGTTRIGPRSSGNPTSWRESARRVLPELSSLP